MICYTTERQSNALLFGTVLFIAVIFFVRNGKLYNPKNIKPNKGFHGKSERVLVSSSFLDVNAKSDQNCQA